MFYSKIQLSIETLMVFLRNETVPINLRGLYLHRGSSDNWFKQPYTGIHSLRNSQEGSSLITHGPLSLIRIQTTRSGFKKRLVLLKKQTYRWTSLSFSVTGWELEFQCILHTAPLLEQRLLVSHIQRCLRTSNSRWVRSCRSEHLVFLLWQNGIVVWG